MEAVAADCCVQSTGARARCKTGNEHSAHSSFLRTCSPWAPCPMSPIPQGEELRAWDTVTHFRPRRKVIDKLGFGPKSDCCACGCFVVVLATSPRASTGFRPSRALWRSPSVNDQSASLTCRAPKGEFQTPWKPPCWKREGVLVY